MLARTGNSVLGRHFFPLGPPSPSFATRRQKASHAWCSSNVRPAKIFIATCQSARRSSWASVRGSLRLGRSRSTVVPSGICTTTALPSPPLIPVIKAPVLIVAMLGIVGARSRSDHGCGPFLHASSARGRSVVVPWSYRGDGATAARRGFDEAWTTGVGWGRNVVVDPRVRAL